MGKSPSLGGRGSFSAPMTRKEVRNIVDEYPTTTILDHIGGGGTLVAGGEGGADHGEEGEADEGDEGGAEEGEVADGDDADLAAEEGDKAMTTKH